MKIIISGPKKACSCATRPRVYIRWGIAPVSSQLCIYCPVCETETKIPLDNKTELVYSPSLDN